MSDVGDLLSRIGLRAAADAVHALLSHAQKSKMSHRVLLEQLVELELRERDARNLLRRTKAATLGTFKPLDQFEWTHPKQIDRERYEHLLSLDFIENAERWSCPPSPVTAATSARRVSIANRIARYVEPQMR